MRYFENLKMVNELRCCFGNFAEFPAHLAEGSADCYHLNQQEQR